MRVVVDTNVAFSAILNSNSRIAQVLLQPKSKFNFYSTDILLEEINEHKEKLKFLSGLSKFEINKSIALISKKIKFIDVRFIPSRIIRYAEDLLVDIDLDDVEFVALTEHISGRLWTGDKVLLIGL